MTAYINENTLEYPVFEGGIRAAYPDTIFPRPFIAPAGYSVVQSTSQPAITVVQRLAEGSPEQVGESWQQTWQVVPKFTEYTGNEGVLHTVAEQEAAAIVANTAAKNAALLREVQDKTQARLDDFAQTHNYAGILSACTYVGSKKQKFNAEGQYAKDARDDTWSKLYEILAEVQAGTRPVPSGYAEVASELPALVWPV